MLLDFYRAVLPSTGPFCLFKGQTKSNEWYDTLEDLASATADYAHVGLPDVYFATAAFASFEGRTASNATVRRSICFDIDAGAAKAAKHGDKVYASQQEALAAVVQWCKSHEVAPRYIVSSGMGLHVYFTLEEDVARSEWLPVANGIKERALADGLRIDPTITGDFVRVLRPPTTLHRSGARVEVLWQSNKSHPLAELAAKFAPLARATPADRPRSLNDDLLDNAYVGPPRSVLKVVKHCGAIRHVARQGGNVPEPYWRAMLGVVKFTVEGEVAAHQLSSGHPDYSYEETQAKFDRWNAGPTSCDTLAAENPEACGKCQWRGKIKSPIVLGNMSDAEVQAKPEVARVVEERRQEVEASLPTPTPAEDEPRMPWEGYLPEGVSVDAGGRMCAWRDVKTPNPDGTLSTTRVLTAFSPVVYWFPQWADATHSGDEAVMDMFVYKIDDGRVDHFRMPVKLAAKNDTLLGFLAAYSILPMSNETKNMHADFVRASLERIRRSGLRPKITSRLGVDYDRSGALFVAHGEFVCSADASISRGIVGDRLVRAAMDYTVDLPASANGSWSYDEWYEPTAARAKRHVDFLNKHYGHAGMEPYRLAIALAWASPMLPFVEGTFVPRADLAGGGLTVSLHSTSSGRGKSHAQRNAALAFGDPGRLVQQRDERATTENARTEILAHAGTLPVFMDEMGEVQPEATANLIGMIGNGATRERMTRELSTQGGHKIALIALMSTNRSQRELVSLARTESPAMLRRMLEIGCDSVPDVQDDGTYGRDLAALQDCRGAVGLLIHSTMAKLGGEALNKLASECAEKARAMIGGTQDGRFLWRALGAMLAVRRILKYHGLELFNTTELVAEFKKWHDIGYQFAAENTLPQDGAALLSLMLTELTSKTLFTSQFGSDDGTINVPLNDRMPDTVVARAVTDDRVVYVSIEAIKEWAFRRKAAFSTLMSRAKESGLLVPAAADQPTNFTHRVNLYYGTKLNQGSRIGCVCIRMASEAAGTGSNVTPLRRRPPAPADQMPSSAASP